MGKYKCKHVKRRKVGSYVLGCCDYPVTWHGKRLLWEAKHSLIIGDIVRIILDDYTKIYVRIIHILSRTHFRGIVCDPYNGGDKCWCDHCNEIISPDQLVACSGYTDNNCNYHLHKKCHKLLLKKNMGHCHKMTKPPYIDGDIFVFDKNSICEIPNWTKNTQYINDCMIV